MSLKQSGFHQFTCKKAKHQYLHGFIDSFAKKVYSVNRWDTNYW